MIISNKTVRWYRIVPAQTWSSFELNHNFDKLLQAWQWWKFVVHTCNFVSQKHVHTLCCIQKLSSILQKYGWNEILSKFLLIHKGLFLPVWWRNKKWSILIPAIIKGNKKCKEKIELVLHYLRQILHIFIAEDLLQYKEWLKID